MQIDRNLVVEYWSKMLVNHNAKVRLKQNSRMMGAMGRVLEWRGVMGREQFGDMVTTVGDTVYTPFKLGTAYKGWTLQEQLISCAHEMVHVVQADGNTWRFYARYLFSDEKRVEYEMEAYAANLLMHHTLTGKFLHPSPTADLLRNYKSTAAQRIRAARYYKGINDALANDRLTGPPAAVECVKVFKGIL